MQQLNPGLAKGYALDFASPLRYVAVRLHEGARSLDDLAEGYEHDADDLDRVWDQELRAKGQRRSTKPDVQQERRTEAKRWLLEAAVSALGDQVRDDDGVLSLTVPPEDLRVGGFPVVLTESPPRDSDDEPKRERPGKRAAGRRATKPTEAEPPAEPEAEPEPPPPPPSPLRAWMDEHDYTEGRLIKDLDLGPREIASYVEGEREVPRVVWLALWALERGAEV